jgi:hypothetical protein
MKQIADQLQDIIEKGIRNNPMPYRKGNSIRIGKVIVRESKSHGHIIFDAEKNKQIATAYSLTASLAIAKLHLSDKPIKSIQELDRKLVKHSNDCLFYKHILNSTTDQSRKDIVYDRYYVAKDIIDSVKYSLENIIFSQ